MSLTIIKPSDFRFIRWVTLNTPMETVTKDGMKINYKSTKIGKICIYKKTGEIVYLTYRGGSAHFLRIYSAFGIDVSLVEKFLTEYQKGMGFGIKKQNMKIVFFYDGVREHRYYYTTLDELKRLAIEDGFSSDKGGQITTWSQQYFVKLKELDVLGYAENDIAVLKHREQMSKWKKIMGGN